MYRIKCNAQKLFKQETDHLNNPVSGNKKVTQGPNKWEREESSH